jgi:acetylornithine deacetylase/succinyl-diaminopimelate desuccinylase-like protein
MDAAVVAGLSERVWEADALPTLHDYIRIPNVSPHFAPDWAERGDMARAVELFRTWSIARPIDGLTVEVVQLEGRTPLIFMEVPPAGGGQADDTVLLYGHLDKQPEMTGWREGLGPWDPVREGDRLYGRGAADDGYAMFAALTAIEAVRAGGGAHTRAVVVIESSEESGSSDLPAYVEHLADRIGTPSLVVCLDSGCPTYDRLWVTTSLRGLVHAVVSVTVLTEGVHSGSAGGLVPSSFRILRQLLSRLEDETTGELLLPELHVEVPTDRVAQAKQAADELGDTMGESFPVVDGLTLVGGDPTERLLNRTWRPTLATVGMDGIPSTVSGGNVLRPFTRAAFSLRLPPTVDPEHAMAAVRDALTADPPYGAHVDVDVEGAAGWNAPAVAPWLEEAVDTASVAAFGEPARYVGEGGSIPFMAQLGERFPDAQFVITGVLGPGSNAHGPNEFLHVPTVKAVTAAVAHVLDAHARRDR